LFGSDPGAQDDNFEIQRLMDNHNQEEQNAASTKEKAQDVIANSIEKSKNANEQSVKDGLDLSSAYQEATPINPVFDSVYGQTQGAEAKEEMSDRDGSDPVFGSIFLGGPVGTKIGEEIGAELQDDTSDGLDLSSVYQEATPINPVFDSVYGQIQGAAPPKVDPTQYPPDRGSPGSGEELPDGNANGIPGEYGDGPDLDGNGVSDEIGINPDMLREGYPGPTIDPALFDPTAAGPTIDPALFDPSAPGPTVDPALLDPTAPGATIDPALLDPSAPGPTLDPAQLEHGIVESSGIAEPAGFTNPSLMDAPATASQDVHEHDDFFEGGV
jgi:hypothetical protein